MTGGGGVGRSARSDDRDSVVEFVARITLDPEHCDDNSGDDLEQAVQNAIGHTGARVVAAEYLVVARQWRVVG